VKYEYWQLNKVRDLSFSLKKITTAVEGNIAIDLFRLSQGRRLAIVYWRGIPVFAITVTVKRPTTPKFFFSHHVRFGFSIVRWVEGFIEWLVDVEVLSLPTILTVKFVISHDKVTILEVNENEVPN